MIGQGIYSITEWEWLKTQLRLRSIERSASEFVVRYAFAEQQENCVDSNLPEALILCYFWCETTEKLLKKKAPRGEHLKFYRSWIKSERQSLTKIINTLPALSGQFDFKSHIAYRILHNYGTGSLSVCDFYQEKVHWRMGANEIPE